MGERKVLNKYIPHDFDPSLVPRGKRPKDGMVTVRMMLPFSIQCSTCSTFMYRGRKFNSKKEPVAGSEGKYLGIQRYRFYIKCTACSRPVTFLTDPKNADYEMESGATRNYEVYKDEAKTNVEADLEKEQEEKDDPTKALENRVINSQKEQQDMDNLEMIMAMNKKHQQLSKGAESSGFGEAKAVLMAREDKQQQVVDTDLNEHGLTENEEAMVKAIKFGKQNGDTIRRLNEEDEKMIDERRQREATVLEKQQSELSKRAKTSDTASGSNPLVPVIKVKRRKVNQPSKKNKRLKKDQNSSAGLGGLLGVYGDSDSD